MKRKPGSDPLGPDARSCSRAESAGWQSAHDLREICGGRLQPFDRACLRCSVVLALRDRRQAAGVDAIVVTGRLRRALDRLHRWDRIGGANGAVETARGLWGMSGAGRGGWSIRAGHGSEWQVAAIGPAGERLIPFATLSHDGRHAGRAEDWGQCWKRKANQGCRGSWQSAEPGGRPGRGRSRWRNITRGYRSDRRPRSTASWGRSRTCWCSIASMRCRPGIFRGRISTGRAGWGGGRELEPGPGALPGRRVPRARSGAEHIYAVGGGTSGVRLEYESAAFTALGPMCGVDDPEAVLAAHAGL